MGEPTALELVAKIERALLLARDTIKACAARITHLEALVLTANDDIASLGDDELRGHEALLRAEADAIYAARKEASRG